MTKIKNWTYEDGMQRITWWKEEGSEVKTVTGVNCIYLYRDGKYIHAMDDKPNLCGYQLKQNVN